MDKDLELVKRFLDGDESAYNLIAKKYQQKIYWHARRMLGNHMDADDVTIEVLMVIYDKLKTFNSDSSLFTWIYRITSTRSINVIRKRKVKEFFSWGENEEVDHLRAKQDIVGDIENKEKFEILEKALLKLPVKQREVFTLRHFDELTYKEISEITGKTQGTLKANYFHAYKKVMGLFDEK